MWTIKGTGLPVFFRVFPLFQGGLINHFFRLVFVAKYISLVEIEKKENLAHVDETGSSSRQFIIAIIILTRNIFLALVFWGKVKSCMTKTGYFRWGSRNNFLSSRMSIFFTLCARTNMIITVFISMLRIFSLELVLSSWSWYWQFESSPFLDK